MLSPRNPTHLIGLSRDASLIRLLRACGTQEAVLKGASDYDGFFALAEAMPLCIGHPLRETVNRTLQEAVGEAVSLCPHTAREIWKMWTDIHWYGREAVSASVPLVCPWCAEARPVELKAEALTRLPDPAAVRVGNMEEWSRALEASLTAGEYPLFSLSDTFEFVRPNPYHANLAVNKAAVGDTLSDGERHLLIVQAMRVWGQFITRTQWKGVFLLRGGHPNAVVALLDYLDQARTLPRLIWIPQAPSDAGRVCGLYPGVETGIELSRCRTEEEQTMMRAYAAVAPIGRAVVIRA